MSKSKNLDGFVLSESAMYAYEIQDVFEDPISFAAAIPFHLRQLFLIPISVTTASENTRVATKILNLRLADGLIPSGQTPESDLFGTETFNNFDSLPTITDTDPGSIFDIDGADEKTHHQDYEIDENIQVPTDTTFMEDIDITQYFKYPYRTDEKPVRHSFKNHDIMLFRLALRPESITTRTPAKIKNNAYSCSVNLISFDKKDRVFTFNVNCGNENHEVRCSIYDLDNVAIRCDCNFWQYNGPEFHAVQNDFMFESPQGTASPPDIRDPDRQYWLCKHAYAVLKRLDSFISNVKNETEETEEEEVLEKIDEDWDEMEDIVEIPIDESEDLETDWDIDDIEEDDEEESKNLK